MEWIKYNYWKRREEVKVFFYEKPLTYGVPQGSILRAIFFLFFTSDINNSSKILKFFLFADNTSTLLIGNNIDKIEKIHHWKLDNMKPWLYANRHAPCYIRYR